MKKSPVTIGIDPAAPNGDASAMAFIQGNKVHQAIFDELAKYQGDPRQLPPLNYGGTVTGRMKMPFNPPMWQVPKMSSLSSGTRFKHYLLRQLEVVAHDESNLNLSMTLHLKGKPGDVLVTLSYMGKYRVYFWVGKKKHFWRKVDSRKYPDLMPQLRAALLLQT